MKLKLFFKIITILFLIVLYRGPTEVYAAWNDNALDYYNTYGETVIYKNSYFWYVIKNDNTNQYGDVNYYNVGFNVNVPCNGTNYSFVAKLDSENAFKWVHQIGSENSTYKLYKMEYNNTVVKLKNKYPNIDSEFYHLNDKTISSSFEFTPIVSAIHFEEPDPMGGIDDDGNVLFGPVCFDSNDFTEMTYDLRSEGFDLAWDERDTERIFDYFGISVDGPSKQYMIETYVTGITWGPGIIGSSTVDDLLWVSPNIDSNITLESRTKKNSQGVYPDKVIMSIYIDDDINKSYTVESSYKMVNGEKVWIQNTTISDSILGKLEVSSVTNTFFVYGGYEGDNRLLTKYTIRFKDDTKEYKCRYIALYNGFGMNYSTDDDFIKIDKDAPTITGGEDVDWTNIDVPISISATDLGVGIKSLEVYETRYRELIASNNGKTPLSFVDLNKYSSTYEIVAKDWVGNEIRKNFTVRKEIKAPTINISGDTIIWYKSYVGTITGSDGSNESGLKKIEYKLEGAENQSWREIGNGDSIILLNSGITTITARAIDNAGNVTTVSKDIKVDNVSPTINVSSSAEEKTWINSNPEISISAVDDASGVATIEYSLGGDTYKAYTPYTGEPIVFRDGNTGKNFIYIRVKDYAGNVSGKTMEFWIDRAGPYVSVAGYNLWSNDEHQKRVFVIEGRAPIVKKEYKIEGDNAQDWTIIDDSIKDLSDYYSDDYILPLESGEMIIHVRAEDTIGNVSYEYREVNYDEIAPTGVFETNPKTTSRDITINVSSLYDIHSGVETIRVSNYPIEVELSEVVPEGYTYEEYELALSRIEEYNLEGKTSDSIKFTLDEREIPEENYGERTVYIKLYDIAGNSTNYQIKTELIQALKAPLIISPKDNNPLYLKGDDVNIKWLLNGGDNTSLEQKAAIIKIRNLDTNKEEIVEINGNRQEHLLSKLEDGQYEVSVKTSVLSPYFSDESVVRFRYNKYSDTGLVRTIQIKARNNLKYLAIVTNADIPKGSSVEGKIYYKLKENGDMDYTKYIDFDIEEKNEIIPLLEPSFTIQVDLIMKNSAIPKNPAITPLVDDITIYAK